MYSVRIYNSYLLLHVDVITLIPFLGQKWLDAHLVANMENQTAHLAGQLLFNNDCYKVYQHHLLSSLFFLPFNFSPACPIIWSPVRPQHLDDVATFASSEKKKEKWQTGQVFIWNKTRLETLKITLWPSLALVCQEINTGPAVVLPDPASWMWPSDAASMSSWVGQVLIFFMEKIESIDQIVCRYVRRVQIQV